MKETSIERNLRQSMEKIGGFAFKMTGTKGIPDRLVLFPGGKAVFVETKKPKTGVTSERQKFMAEVLRFAGFEVHTITSTAQVKALIGETLKKTGGQA